LTREKILERTVDGLQKVYAVVVALALGQAIRGLVTSPRADTLATFSEVLARIPPFGAFLVTLVPFFHGMNRHLDRCYLDRSIAFPRWGAFLFDFCVFFVQSSLLFLIALSLSDPPRAFLFVGLLLFLDVLWGLTSHAINPSPGEHPLRWAVVNIVTLPVGVMLTVLSVVPDGARPWILFGLTCARTIVDYKVSWPFYFPGGDEPVERKSTAERTSENASADSGPTSPAPAG
jgi:hypothetical protein